VVKVSSEPAGATITRNGSRVGVTPLTLSDQTPGEVRYEVNLAGYEPATLMGRVESGKMLSLSVPLLSVDRIASMAELDESRNHFPRCSRTFHRLGTEGGRVEIQLTVTKTGATKDSWCSARPIRNSEDCASSRGEMEIRAGQDQGQSHEFPRGGALRHRRTVILRITLASKSAGSSPADFFCRVKSGSIGTVSMKGFRSEKFNLCFPRAAQRLLSNIPKSSDGENGLRSTPSAPRPRSSLTFRW